MSPPNAGANRLRRPMSSVSGLNLLARIIWYRAKAKINRVLYHPQAASTPPIQRSNSLPHEIVEMIIDLLYDAHSLKACSLTCYSWYIAAVPHIHHTLVLNGVKNRGSEVLSNRHALGLLPFTKEIRILQPISRPGWFIPQFFSNRVSRHFFAVTNIQTLSVQCLDIMSFSPRLGHYFGHLSPTLRSLTLYAPRCTALQLSHFISSFPNLNDVIIRYFAPVGNVPDEMLTPLSTPKLGGKLVLVSSDAVETWEHLAISCGLRFRYIRVWGVKKCVPVLLDACATTLETLRIELLSDNEWYQQTLVRDHNLSKLAVLRSFQIKTTTRFLVTTGFLAVIESIFRTITSPIFSELTFIIWFNRDTRVDGFPADFFDTLRRMYCARPFKLEFLCNVRAEGAGAWGGEWEGWIRTAANEGPLRCLEYPPSFHFCRNGAY